VLRDVLLRRPARVDDLVHGRLSDREPVDQLHAQRLAAIQTSDRSARSHLDTDRVLLFSDRLCLRSSPLDERDEEALSPGTRLVELGDSQTGCLL
jgi:hypothetical protein